MMRIVRTLAAVVVVAGPAAAWSASASAAVDPFTGVYSVFYGDEPEASGTWLATSICDDATTCAAGVTSLSGWNTEARLTGDKWTLSVSPPDGVQCDDGSKSPGTQTWTWDAATLAGTVSGVADGTPACRQGPPANFHLVKTA